MDPHPADPTTVSRPEPYSTVEHGKVPVPLSELMVGDRIDIFPEVTGKGYLRVNLKGNSLEFQAGGFVGLIPINERVVIDVRPRVPVQNIERIFALSGETLAPLPGDAQDYAVQDDLPPSLLDLFAIALLDSLIMFRTLGLMKEYVAVERETSFPSGRFLMDRTIKRYRSRNVRYLVSTTKFEHTPDIPANRCIKTSLWTLSRLYRALPQQKGRREILRRINEAYHLFDRVSLDTLGSLLADPLLNERRPLPTSRGYYRNPIRISTAILRHQGISLLSEGRDVALPPFVINMQHIFEAFLLAMLRDRLSLAGTSLIVLNGNERGNDGGERPLFDDVVVPVANPDIVIQRSDGQVLVVIDAKYKLAQSREDINQVIAYGAAYRAPHVILVLPKTDTSGYGREHLGRIAELTVHRYRFDLSATNLDQEIDDLTDFVIQLVSDAASTI